MKKSVTQIISEIFPVDNTMFEKALSQESIEKKRQDDKLIPWGIADTLSELRRDNVMLALTAFGSHLHNMATDAGLLWIRYKESRNIISPHLNSLYEFLDTAEILRSEQRIETEDYTGTYDALCRIDDKNYLIDYKTWTAYKYLYGFSNDILKKNGEPYSRSWDLKKVSLQLSMYKAGITDIEIHGMKVAWLTEQWVFLFDCTDDLTLFHKWKREQNGITLKI